MGTVLFFTPLRRRKNRTVPWIFYFANKLYKISSAKIAIASAKIKDKIITINIFGLAEGLRAMDLTAAYPTKAITADGPAVLKNIRIVNTSVDIDLWGRF